MFGITNSKNNNKVTIGSCCCRRFGINISWRSKADYLRNAILMAQNDWERNFAKTILDEIPRWSSRLIISKKRKDILERITGRLWKGKTWEDLGYSYNTDKNLYSNT